MPTEGSPTAAISTRRNGLEHLAQLGVPPAAITSLLIVLAVLTLLPHAGGRDFGPYSMPQLVRVPAFWTFALVTPVLWVGLLARLLPFDRTSARRMVKMLLIVEIVALAAAALTSPVQKSLEFEFVVPAGQPVKARRITIPFAQNIEVAAHGIDERFQVHLYICEEMPSGEEVPEGEISNGDNCVQAQRPIDAPLKKWVNAGSVRIWLFNYEQNQVPLRGVMTVRYTARRAI
jgi:hypothetical protein